MIAIPMDEKGNYFKSRFRSFRNAFVGLFFTLKTQANFKIQLFVGGLAIILGFGYGIYTVTLPPSG